MGFASPEHEASFRSAEQQGGQAWAQADVIDITVRLSLPADAASTQAVLTVTPEARMATDYAGPSPSAPALLLVGDRPVSPDAGVAAAPVVDPAWEADPVLGARQSFQVALSAAQPGDAEAGTLNHVLPQIAEGYGINLVADAYRAEPLSLTDLTAGVASTPGASEAKTRRLYEVLNLLVAPTARWSREGDFLHVRRRTWMHHRLAEVPERVAKAWAAHLRQSGRFSLDDATRLVVTLRDEQLASFEAVMREHGLALSLLFDTDTDEAARQQAILRAYGSLLPLQRQRLRAGGAVPVAAMTPNAQRWLRRALAARHDAAVEAGAGRALDGVLTLSPAPSGAEDEGDIAPAVAETGEEPRPADKPAPRVEPAELHGVVFRFISPGNAVEAISVMLPQAHPEMRM
jgi:hypothetical protein